MLLDIFHTLAVLTDPEGPLGKITQLSTSRDYAGFGTPPPPPRGAMGGKQKHIIIVKGVALTVSMGDLIKFFTGRQPPKNVEIKYGEAIVEFNTHADAMMEMLKDKTNLGMVYPGTIRE